MLGMLMNVFSIKTIDQDSNILVCCIGEMRTSSHIIYFLCETTELLWTHPTYG